MNHPIVSIVLGTYNRLLFLKLAIESVRKEIAEMPHEIIIIDGGSTDGTIPYLEQQKDIITIIQPNREEVGGKLVAKKSWGYFMNLGFKRAQGKFICMISDDCLIVPDAIKNGIKLFEKEIVTGKKIGEMAFFWRNWPAEQKYKILTTFGDQIYVNHGLFLKEVLEKVGYIDENNFDFYCADSDLALKMKQAGYETIVSSDSYVEHFSNANPKMRNTNSERLNKDTENFKMKWRDIFNIKNYSETQEKRFVDKAKTADKFKTIFSVKMHINVYTKLEPFKRFTKILIRKALNFTFKRLFEKTQQGFANRKHAKLLAFYKTETERLAKNCLPGKSLKLHFGCGPRVLKNWINIDLVEQYLPNNIHHEKIPLEIRDNFYIFDFREISLPLSDNSVDAVFHEDFIEHLDQQDQIMFLAETYRVLKPGGIHRVSTPELLKSMRFSNFSKGKKGVYTNEWFEHGHFNVLTKCNLEEMARMIGYTKIDFNQKNKSQSPLIPPEYRPESDRSEDDNFFADLIK